MTQATTESLNNFIQKQHAHIKDLEKQLISERNRIKKLEAELKKI
jgi:septal ring factor EnvC (AmiA/AmiB activator)